MFFDDGDNKAIIVIDLVKLTGFEFKWKAKPRLKLPKTFTETYSAHTKIIDRSNFRDFVII